MQEQLAKHRFNPGDVVIVSPWYSDVSEDPAYLRYQEYLESAEYNVLSELF